MDIKFQNPSTYLRGLRFLIQIASGLAVALVVLPVSP